MKTPFNIRAPSFDADAVVETIRRALTSAGLDTTSGPMHGVTETVRRALSSSGMTTAPPSPVANDAVIDVVARVVDVRHEPSDEPVRLPPRGDPQARGTFDAHQFTGAAGTRAYKLYVPADLGASPSPMIVMLHGCTQSADDFAAGTRMNQLADEHGFVVVYPEQPASVNPSKCWSWFKTQDQRRDVGEPSLIAGIVRDVASRHTIDERRIFVAGLSAGAAMAVILGETYPELIAGVGAHSGLPYGCAHDVPSALAAMKGGRSGMAALKNLPGAGVDPRTKAARAVPIIVFHGDRDHTVQQTNGAEVVQQSKDAHAKEMSHADMRISTERGTLPGGRSYSRVVHADAHGQTHIESWTVHGAGHAWSGGSPSGSFTDGAGPDASAAMVRFFLALPRAGSA